MPSTVRLPEAFLDKAREMAERKLIRAFKEIGDACVSEAVDNGNYKDNTGNLRSSVGYVVSRDGAVVEEGGFWRIGFGDGSDIGRAGAYELASQTKGTALLLVAGMQYATYVADKGYNVLDSAEILAHRLISQLK